jgi:hypothetical protein
VLLAFFFVATGWAGHDFGKAFEIMTGTYSPFWTESGWASVTLAVLGWLLIPAVSGAVIAAVLESGWRPPTPQQAADKTVEDLDRAREGLRQTETNRAEATHVQTTATLHNPPAR